MAEQHNNPGDATGGRLPLMQRLYDSPFVLLIAGILVMVVFYTAWGLWEILRLPQAPLP